jgi:hypothetical protein
MPGLEYAGVEYAGWDESGLDPGEEAGVAAMPVHVQPFARNLILRTKQRMIAPRMMPMRQRPQMPPWGQPHVRPGFPMRPGPRWEGGAPTEPTLKRTILGLADANNKNIPFIVFTATSGTELAFAVTPQRDFQGGRLIVDSAGIGTSTTGILGVVTSVLVGDVEQIPTSGGVPFSMLRPDATESGLDITNCRGGLTITVTCVINTAPTTTDTFTVTAGFYGHAIGQ